METLLLGQPGLERRRVTSLLEGQGVSVRACHDDPWGCVALHDECPLDTRPVDVAVVVAEPGAPFDPHGVACARRARVPVVTVGGLAGDPISEIADDHHPSIDDQLCPLLSEVANAGARHRHAVLDAADGFLRDGESIDVTVERSTTSVRAVVDGAFAPDRAATICDQVRAAIRRFDPSLQVIDVSARPE